MPRGLSRIKKIVVPALLVAAFSLLILLLLLIIPSFSGIAMAIGPPPQLPWEIGEPFSPVGFAVASQPLGKGMGYEFTMLNGTSASVTIQVKPTTYAEFPLNLNFSMRAVAVTAIYGQRISTGLRNVSAILSPDSITLKNVSDRANVTITFTARKDATDTLYGIDFGIDSGPGISSSFGPVFYLRVNPAHITWTGTTTTAATTTTATTITTVISTTTVSTTLTNTITTTSTEQVTEPSTYGWAISATVATVVLAVILLVQRRTASSRSR